ncbi:hypothetical protein [Treponema sp. R80B11-R83G3]
MKQNIFTEWERVFVAIDDNNMAGLRNHINLYEKKDYRNNDEKILVAQCW